ncbi:MAG: hypothetical protein BRD23_09965 [Halobacteriales archaeon SW_9_67_25]|nr:MAG: hypothetical protein BRD23_09965 [Halobacteriales archaeon SW_9_67_25]
MADRDGHSDGDGPRDDRCHRTTDHHGSPARRAAAGVPAETRPERDSPSDPPGAESTAPDPPGAVALVGRAGVVLAVGSLGLAVVGVGGFAVGLQPYGAIATVLALAGITVAMVLGMAHQAYVGDWMGE